MPTPWSRAPVPQVSSSFPPSADVSASLGRPCPRPLIMGQGEAFASCKFFYVVRSSNVWTGAYTPFTHIAEGLRRGGRVSKSDQGGSGVECHPFRVSQQIRALERHLGTRLITRTQHGIALTSQGENLSGGLLEAFAAMASLTENVSTAEAVRPLLVSATPMFASAFLMPRLSGFIEEPKHRIKDRIDDSSRRSEAGRHRSGDPLRNRALARA
jgi:hypothetical protein